MLGMDGGFCTGGGQQGVFVINKNAKRDQAGEKESQQQSDFRPPFWRTQGRKAQLTNIQVLQRGIPKRALLLEKEILR